MRKAAAQWFADGERAFKAREFVRAGDAFEAAHRLAPHPSALFNAARSWERAGEIARAANLYARYVREAPADAPDRERVATSLAELASKLGLLHITGAEPSSVLVDGQKLEGPDVYVSAGTHAVHARVGRNEETRKVSADAGAAVAVAFGADVASTPASAASATPSPAPITKTTPQEPVPTNTEATSGWSPVVVLIGGGFTLFAASWTVWSGVDTLNARDAFDAEPTPEHFDEGRRRQARTNILLGTTIASAAFTGVAAIWFVDWKGASKQKKRALPASGRLAAGRPDGVVVAELLVAPPGIVRLCGRF
jgi:hypothetical protein